MAATVLAKPSIDGCLGYQQISSFSTAQTLTVPSGAKFCIVVCETNAVRWRDDGTAPTASVGMPLSVSQPLLYTAGLATVQFIPQTGNATLNVSYYA